MKSKTSHTPGPWKVKDGVFKSPSWDNAKCEGLPTGITEQKIQIVCAGEELGIAYVFDWFGDPKANARLIAAAPELLGMVKYALSVFESMNEFQRQKLEDVLDEDIRMGDMANLIHKAEGK